MTATIEMGGDGDSDDISVVGGIGNEVIVQEGRWSNDAE